MISRDLLEALEPYLKRRETLAITGPRQAGKTTFLESLKDQMSGKLKISPEKIQMITFEDRRLLMEFERDAVGFTRSYRPSGAAALPFYLMIDEFQYAAEGGQKLKLIYDTVKDVKIIVTGSSSLDLKAKVGKYMIGRILNFQLLPFHFGEILRAKDGRLENIYRERSAQVHGWLFEGKTLRGRSRKDEFREEMLEAYEDYVLWGGYPAVVLSPSREVRKKVLSEIYNNFILKDIKTLLELATEKNLFLLAQHLAAQTGQIVVYENLCQVSGLDFRKMKKHLSILEETFILRQVRPYFVNRQKELVKNPKVYFVDTGFRNSLVENTAGLAKRPDAGALIENTAFIRLHQLPGAGIDKINFWRTKVGAEVDFILHAEEKRLPVEVKFSSFDQEKITRGLASFIDAFRPPRVLVLTRDFWGGFRKDQTDIRFAPVYYL